MLDFNTRESFADKVNHRIDTALTSENAGQEPRDYLGASRLGVECDRALQYEYLNVPKDEGQGFNGRTLRIFAAGHVFDQLFDSRDSGRASDQHNLVEVGILEFGILHSLLDRVSASFHQIIGQGVELGS